ncbi:MAG: DUF4286 family protein [Halobacteriovoraceae bacterium]|nr:DUF4286 family protein [Halobacteriovoraceae bacterium]
MIVYEVNLTIEREILDDFNRWLKEHVKEILEFPGFDRAEIYMEEELENSISVRYFLQKREDLQNYLDNHAKKMRGKGIEKFKDKFSAQRRILFLQS